MSKQSDMHISTKNEDEKAGKDDFARYAQSPKDFRKQVWNWVSDSHRGGEAGRVIITHGRSYSNTTKKHLWKAFSSRFFRSLIVVFTVSIVGVWLKTDPRKPEDGILETIFDNLESIAIGSAGIIFLLEVQDRKRRDYYEAWQVISSAQGQTGSAGRIEALQALNRDGVSLERVVVSGAYLEGVVLNNAVLKGADFKDCKLLGAKLKGAELLGAKFQNSNLSGATLEGADLLSADLENAWLGISDFNNTQLWNANMRKTIISNSQFRRSNLGHADLEESEIERSNFSFSGCYGVSFKKASIIGCSFENAELGENNFDQSILINVSFEGAKNLSLANFDDSYICGVLLPDGTIENRDCERLKASFTDNSYSYTEPYQRNRTPHLRF